jgi:hypothetical protein
MQELLADILPYLAAFYLLELVVSLGRHHLLFASGGRRFRLMTAGLGALPPWPGAEAIASQGLPLLLDANRLWFADPRRPYAPQVLGADDLCSVELAGMGEVTSDRKRVTAGKELIAVAPTLESAAAMAQRLDSLRRLDSDARAAALETVLREATDLAALRKMRAAQRAFAPWMQVGAWLLFLLLFAAMPWQVYLAPKLELDLASLALMALGLLAVDGALAAALLARMGRRPAEIAKRIAPLVLLPFSAIHPLVHLSRELYLRFHWSALAAVLLPRSEFRTLARQELRRIALCAERAEGTQVLAWEREKHYWTRVLDQLEEPLEPLLAEDPDPADPLAVAYCPLCSASFGVGAERCSDCDAALRPLLRVTES